MKGLSLGVGRTTAAALLIVGLVTTSPVTAASGAPDGYTWGAPDGYTWGAPDG